MKQNDTGMYFTTKDVQTILKVSRSTLHRWRKEKKIKAKKIGGTVRFHIDDIKKAMK